MKKIFLVKYGEVALRGNNRYLFESRLIKIIKNNLPKNYWVTKEQGRILVQNKYGDVDYKLIPNIVNVMGIVGVCHGVLSEDQSIEVLRILSLEYMREHYGQVEVTFKVETRRANKKYPIESRDVSADIGGYLLENMDNLKVDVKTPQVVLSVELRNNAYIFSKVIKGWGGLPVGSSGKGLVLLSGGIDSPVAAFMAAKRGVELEAVYFHSPPFTSERAKIKVMDLAARLSVFTGECKLHVVHFTDIQVNLKENCKPERLTILLKRAMLKCAEKIANEIGADGLITGDSIGQVASQTMRSLHAVSSATSMPVLRPLSGMDKIEIVDLSKKIETYDISIRPYEDCCTVFVAKHPETRPKVDMIEKEEANVEGLDEMIELAVKNREVLDI